MFSQALCKCIIIHIKKGTVQMVSIQKIEQQDANYSAVKIRVNDARTYNMSDKDLQGGIYNATDIEVNRPAVYTYPLSKEVVTYAMSQVAPVKVPKALPASVPVPEPNVTTPEAEKNLTFHGVSFKAAPQKVEIVPPEDIKPDVDISEVTAKLSSEDFDVQAMQLHEIVKKSQSLEGNKNPYIAPEVFESLINIIQKDSNELAKPTQAQNEAREKLKKNLIAADKAFAEGVDPKDFKEPYEMTEDEMKLALSLTPFEQADRNKAYALAVTSLLAKSYADGVEKQTGNIVPLTDLPGASAMVDTLRHEKNPDVRLSALDSLRYISRPEYNEELVTIFTLATKDKDPKVAQYAAIMAIMLSDKQPENKSQAA